MTLKQKFDSIDQSKLNSDQKDFLGKIEKATKNFTSDNKEVNDKVEGALDKMIATFKEKMPEVIKSKEAKKEPKASAKKVSAKPSQTSSPKRTVMSVAKEIRKDGESWADAQKRAKAEINKDKKSAEKEVKTEMQKLMAFIKTRKELEGISGTDLGRDSSRSAKKRGARVVTHSGSTSNQYGTYENKLGRKYWESRDRHSDRLAPNYPKDAPLLENGGDVDAKNWMGYDKDHLMHKETGVIVLRGTNLKDIQPKDIKGIDMLSNQGYSKGGMLSPRERYILEIQGLTNLRVGAIETYINDNNLNESEILNIVIGLGRKQIRATDMVTAVVGNPNNSESKKIISFAKSNDALKMELGGNVGGYDLAGHLDGTFNVGQNDGDLSGVTGTSYSGLVGETGAMSSGELFMNGGGIANSAQHSYMIVDSFGNPAQHYELGGTVVADLAGHTGGGDGGLNANMPLSGVSGTSYSGLVGETGTMSSGEMFARGGSVKNERRHINHSQKHEVRYDKKHPNPKRHGYGGMKYSEGGDFQAGVYAEGGSLENHGIKEGDTFIKTISGGIQKVKDKDGKIVFINLATGERDSQPPLPFDDGGEVTYFVNKDGIRVRSVAKPDEELSEKEWMAKHSESNEARAYADGGKVNKNFVLGDDIKITKPFPNGNLTGKKGKIVEIAKNNTGVIYILVDGKRIAVTEEYISKSYAEGGDIEAFSMRMVKGSGAKPTEVLTDEKSVKFAKGGSLREKRNEYLSKLSDKEADIWDKLGANSGVKIRGDKKMLKAYAEAVEEMLIDENVQGRSFDQEDYDFYTDQNSHLFNDFLVWNGYYKPDMTVVEKKWREKAFKEGNIYVSDPEVITVKGVSKKSDKKGYVQVTKTASREYVVTVETPAGDWKQFNDTWKLDELDKAEKFAKRIAENHKVEYIGVDTTPYDAIHGKSKSKNYIVHADIKSVTVNQKGMKYTFKGSDVLNGANVLEKGNLLETKAIYIPKRDVISVELKDGSEFKPSNGYWIKKDAKGELFKPKSENSKINLSNAKTKFGKGVYGNDARTEFENINGYDWQVVTMKRSSGDLVSTAKGGKKEISSDGKYSTFTYDNESPSIRLVSSKPSRVTEKVVEIQHSNALQKFKEKIESESYSGGGKVTFKQKANAIAKNFEGKRVEPEYQKEYGKTYDAKEAKEVGNKIAGAQKAKYDAKAESGAVVKRKSGNPKMKEAMVLAKKIRKDGEKWTDAVKRAYAQVK